MTTEKTDLPVEATPATAEVTSTPATEAIQEGAPAAEVVEQPKPVVEAVAPEKTEPTPRMFSEEEVRKIQSSFDKRVAQAEQSARQAAERLEQLDINARVEGVRQQAEKDLLAQNFDPEIASRTARVVAAKEQKIIEAEKRNQFLETRQTDQINAIKTASAHIVATRMKLPDEFIPILQKLNDPEDMMATAQILSRLVQAKDQSRSAVQALVKPVQVESGTEPGSPPSGDQLLDIFNSDNRSHPRWKEARAYAQSYMNGR